MNKNTNGEKITLIIIVFVILIIVGYVLFNVFTSKKALRNNSPSNSNLVNESEETKEIPYINDTTNNISKNSSTINKNENKDNNSHENNSKEINLNEKKKEELLATFSTSIYDKDENRVSNITLANSKLNGTIVKAGTEFSFNNTIGPMNETQGFKKALGFDSNGKKIQISGGGLCQISSTIYNAVLISNLEVTERHPHSRRVYYVPQDKDATIVYGSLDFKFKNNTESDIKIESSNDFATVTINLIKIN